MTPLQLPYVGYSWSLSQHMRRVSTDMRIMFSLLRGAALFGKAEDYADKITAFVIEQGLVPPNVRGSRPQIWRDYQQVLLELGLIVSTRYTHDQVIITQVGLMWLDGLIGNKEMVTTQALRYQYPSGYKLDLSTATRSDPSNRAYSNRVELDLGHDVLIKPAVLVLRILMELHDRGLPAIIANRECVQALMPVKKNVDWPFALDELQRLRRGGSGARPSTRELRHAQEWFALLGATDIFNESDGEIGLSAQALSSLKAMRDLCNYHENPANFWHPLPDSNKDAWVDSWYGYFGTPPLESQWAIPETQRSQEYIQENYIEGAGDVDEPEISPRDLQDWAGEIAVRPFTQGRTDSGPVGQQRGLTPEAIARIARGITRQQNSAYLHDHIVAILANRFQQSGYRVEEDPQSVDLLVNKDRNESILEVKTVNPRNLFSRMRLGVGQLCEYRYRRQVQIGTRPNSLLVLSSSAGFPSWLTEFFRDDIRLGLIALVENEKFVAHTSGAIESFLTS
jgi:hypothetical protein